MRHQNILQESQPEFAYAFLLLCTSKSGDRGADGAAGAAGEVEEVVLVGAAGATGSWLSRVPHRAPLTFIYLLIFINQGGQSGINLINKFLF